MSDVLNRLGNLFFSLRSYTPIPLILIAFIYHQFRLPLVIIGVLILIIGEVIRGWAVGYAGGRTRTRTINAARNLITTGPYAYTRNPLYLGNLLISSGICFVAGVLWLLPVLWILFLLQYIPIIITEEQFLAQTYDQLYQSYLTAVPRFGLRFSPYPKRSSHDFSLRRALKSEKRTLMAIGLLMTLLLGFELVNCIFSQSVLN